MLKNVSFEERVKKNLSNKKNCNYSPIPEILLSGMKNRIFNSEYFERKGSR